MVALTSGNFFCTPLAPCSLLSFRPLRLYILFMEDEGDVTDEALDRAESMVETMLACIAAQGPVEVEDLVYDQGNAKLTELMMNAQMVASFLSCCRSSVGCNESETPDPCGQGRGALFSYMELKMCAKSFSRGPQDQKNNIERGRGTKMITPQNTHLLCMEPVRTAYSLGGLGIL